MQSKKIRHFVDEEQQEYHRLLEEEEEMDDKQEVEAGAVIVIDNVDELCAMLVDEHRIMFQSHYKEEKQWQLYLLKCGCEKSGKVTNAAALSVVTDRDNSDTEDL